MKNKIKNRITFLFILLISFLDYQKLSTSYSQQNNRSSILDNSSESQVIELLDKSNAGDEFRLGVWTDSAMYAARCLYYMKYDKDFKLLADSVFMVAKDQCLYPFTMSLNKKRTKIIFVLSKRSSVSIGGLWEVDLEKKTFKEILDTSANISSAVYYPYDDGSIIYYTYGTAKQGFGYWTYEIETGDKYFLYKPIQYDREIVNGFDISPNGKTLLIPMISDSTPPEFLRFNINGRYIEDFPKFNFTNTLRNLIWLRYNNDGTKVLYSNFTENAFGWVSHPSECGIIDLKTNTRKIIDIRSDDKTVWQYTAPIVNWSPDCKHIIYGRAKIDKAGAVSRYKLYVKTNVDEGVSSVAGNATTPKVMKLE